MELLLHTCCAPCLIYPLERLRSKGFEVTGLFYNPNIHPQAEYERRRAAVEDFSKPIAAEVLYPQYFPSEFFWAVHSKENSPERCFICWRLRLEQTARKAKHCGCQYFSTTLLVSPYQNQELLAKIGEDVAKQEGVEFYYEDFRPGFKDAHNKARDQGIYCQKYCGCIYSELERSRKKGQSPSPAGSVPAV
ncbi:MAG: epoxyqueuosine reductase QueH [Candidatus Omnitrophota bacterium]